MLHTVDDFGRGMPTYRSDRELSSTTLLEYWQAVATAMASEDSWRYGQACFNILAVVRPDLAERVRGTDMDPFHADRSGDKRIGRFMSFLALNW